MQDPKTRVEQGFYQAVAQILGCETDYKPWLFSKRTRWNHRNPGNGRYAGHGMVRRYSSNMIHVALQVPQLAGVYTSEASALEAIALAVKETVK